MARLVDVITDAYRDVLLEDGTTLHEADLEGAYSDDSVRIAARAKDCEADWRDVPDWKVERFASLCFHDLKGWRFYLPAYMIWTLRHWRNTRSCTADWTILSLAPTGGSDDWYLERYATLSHQQASAVYEFLKFFCDFSNDDEPHTAINLHWHEFAPREQ